jgi:uroporphyrin-III C-methyltransferase
MRGVNQAIILATGHDPDEDGTMDWSALARTRQPIVLYMGLRNLDKIAAALRRGGLPADTPAAVIASATLADQQILVSTLDTIAAEAHAANLTAPAMAVIGDIVRTRQQLLETCAKAALMARTGQVTAPFENSTCDG